MEHLCRFWIRRDDRDFPISFSRSQPLSAVAVCAYFGAWWRGRAEASSRGGDLLSSGSRVRPYGGSTPGATSTGWPLVPAPYSLTSPLRAGCLCARTLHSNRMGWTVGEHRWRVAVDPPQTGPPQARLRTAYGRPQTTYKGALRPRTHACHPPSHAPCARTHYRASASRSCADQRWRPPADASVSTTTACASPRRSATRRLLLPMRIIGGSMRRMRMCRTHVHGSLR